MMLIFLLSIPHKLSQELILLVIMKLKVEIEKMLKLGESNKTRGWRGQKSWSVNILEGGWQNLNSKTR